MTIDNEIIQKAYLQLATRFIFQHVIASKSELHMI